MRYWPLLVYAAGAVADFASTYAALLLVPGTVELNPSVRAVLHTPLHPLFELLAFTAVAATSLACFTLEDYWRGESEKLASLAGLAARLAPACTGAFRMIAAAVNLQHILIHFAAAA